MVLDFAAVDFLGCEGVVDSGEEGNGGVSAEE
jgi:hypothetical protein